jgi:hypothetical protein
MKKIILIFTIIISLFIGVVHAEEIENPDEQILVTETPAIEEAPVEIPEEESSKEEVKEEEEKKETKLEKSNKKEKDNYLGPIILIFLILLFLMFSFRNQAKNSKEIIKR